MEPSVAIILVNYNGYDDTVECVKSLLGVRYTNYKIYVVENGSSDSDRFKKDDFLNKNAILMYSEKNLGFSGGNNIAIQDALKKQFDYILLLNNDTIVEAGFLNALVEQFKNNSGTGAVTGKIYYYYDRERVWSAGGTYDRTTGLTVQFSGIDNESFDEIKEITFATGCLLMVSSEVIKQVGFLDESYFLYSEDSDYCQRIMDAGYKLFYTPHSVIYHKVSASTGDRSPLQQQYMMRNNLYMIKKYSPTPVGAHMKMSWHMAKHILRGRRNLKPTLEGYIDYLAGKTGKII